MDDPLRIIAAHEGVFLRSEAIGMGYDDAAIKQSLRAGIIVRVRHGCYCFADVWKLASPEQRHLILARAVARTTPGNIAFSHTTALLLHGVEVWGADLSRVDVTRLDTGAARLQRDVHHHVGKLTENDVTDVGGLIVTTPQRAVLEAGCWLSAEKGLVIADSALHLGLCTPDDLARVFDVLNHWRGSQPLHVVLRLADGRRESPGESRGAYLFWRYGLPRPIFQYEVYDETGTLIATVDFGWPEHGVLGEFDGKVKYGRLLKPGQDPGEVVFQEKRREDLLREATGATMRRIVWDDYDHPRYTARRFAAALHVECLA